MKYIINGLEFKSKKEAENFFIRAMIYGNERNDVERMAFAYDKIQEGCNVIDTRTGYAVKPIKKTRK